MLRKEVFISSAQRTPIGSFQGLLSSFKAPELGAFVLKSSLKKACIDPETIDECIMGQVLTAGSGQAPARQAALQAQIPSKTPCLTINKVCGSGLKAVMLGYDSLLLGYNETVAVGGQESMSQSPYFLTEARLGFRLGHKSVEDGILKDGLLDPATESHMGEIAEKCAKEFQLTRDDQDRFAKESYKYAQQAHKKGFFKDEITPIEVKTRKKTFLVEQDELPFQVDFEKISKLKPAFNRDGTITVANASKINDGASALILSTNPNKALAKIKAHATYAQDPHWFTTAPIFAIEKLLAQESLKISDIDFWEINEAFSCVALATIKKLNLDRSKVNIHGGAVALGHPIGASGARILTTLVHVLHTYQKPLGIVAICLGGGEGLALLVERTE